MLHSLSGKDLKSWTDWISKSSPTVWVRFLLKQRQLNSTGGSMWCQGNGFGNPPEVTACECRVKWPLKYEVVTMHQLELFHSMTLYIHSSTELTSFTSKIHFASTHFPGPELLQWPPTWTLFDTARLINATQTITGKDNSAQVELSYSLVIIWIMIREKILYRQQKNQYVSAK